MTVTLIQIDAWDPEGGDGSGAAVSLRASSHDDPAACHLDGAVWWPSIAQLPRLRYDLFSGSFDGQIDTPSSSVTLIVEPFPTLPRLALADARLRLWTGELGSAFDAYVLRFDGIVTAQPRIEDLTAAIDFAVDDRWLDRPLLSLYAGTTGIEGEAGQKGTPKPLSLGQPRYVPGVLIDSVDTILQLSAYGAIEGIDVAMEKLSRFGAPIGDYADLAALKAAAIPRGGWATCEAQGLVRHGAPIEGLPSYLLRGDAAGPDGWARKPGELIRRIADLLGEADRVSDTSLNALDVARPWNLSIYLADQVTARDIIQRIAASVNAVAGVSWLGELFVVPIQIGDATTTLRSDGTAMPVVGDVKQIEVGQPYWRIALQAQRTWQVHQLSDIAFSAVLTDRGRYAAGETYREGDVVDMPDGSRWLHVGTAPTTGVAPGSDETVWFEMSAALSTEDILYPDGTPVADLQPAEAGATRGAPAGTMVAGKLAEEVLADAAATIALLEAAVADLQDQKDQLSQTLLGYLQKMLLDETRDARLNALSYLDGDGLHTVQRRETQERIDGDTAIVTDMSLIGAKSDDGTAWVLSLDTVKLSPTETFAQRLNEINATFETVEGEVSSNYTELQTAISDETSARTTAITTLTSEVDTLATDTAASIATVQDAVADETSARTTAIEALQATVDTLTTDTSASIETLEEAIADETSARTSALSSLSSTVSTLSGTVNSNYTTLNTAISNEVSARASAIISVYSAIGANTSSITSLNSALSTLTSTEAGHYSTVTASIGSVSSTVSGHTSAIATLQGRTTAYWGITTNAGSGASAFIAAQAETSPGVVTSNVAFGAREIHLFNSVSGTWLKTMSVTAGQVDIFGKLKTTDAVTTPNIVAGNVTQMESTLSGAAINSDGGWANVLGGATWHTFTLDYDAHVLVLFAGRANYFGSSPLIVRMLLYNAAETYLGGVEGPSSGDGAYMPNPCFPAKWSLSAGTYHVSPQFLADAGDVEMRSGSGVIVFWRYK